MEHGTVEFDVLFTRRLPKFETIEGELRAVHDGRKALAWYPMTREQIDKYTDYDDLVEQAEIVGLSVLICPRERQERLPLGVPELDVFVLRPAECWRVESFQACRQTLGRFAWSDASEYLYSVFLGYTEEECTQWIADCRYDRLGWLGQTVYAFLDSPHVELLRPLSLRCFPPCVETASIKVIAHPDGCHLRRDFGPRLPSDSYLCRFALENGFYLRVFEDAQPDSSGLVSAQLAVPPEELNASLVSNIELWVDGSWQR